VDVSPEEKALRAIANLAAQRDQVQSNDELRTLLACIAIQVQRSGIDVVVDAM
jgi:hypothetical protein